MNRLALLLVAVSSLAGCSTSDLETMSPETYRAMQVGLQNDPAYMQWSQQHCVSRIDAVPEADRRSDAARLGIPFPKYSELRCKRLLGDIARGRKTYEDFKNMDM